MVREATRFDQIANTFGEHTTLGWWKQRLDETIGAKKTGHDWQHLLQERIEGLIALRDWIKDGRPMDPITTAAEHVAKESTAKELAGATQ